jgi:hypothetical protein
MGQGSALRASPLGHAQSQLLQINCHRIKLIFSYQHHTKRPYRTRTQITEIVFVQIKKRLVLEPISICNYRLVALVHSNWNILIDELSRWIKLARGCYPTLSLPRKTN